MRGMASSISSVPALAQALRERGVAYAADIAAAAERHHVDPVLLAAVAAQETGGPGSNAGRNVVGDGGHGRGVFQIDDRYHAFARGGCAMDPAANADYAAGMIAGLLSRYGGNVRKALSAYNAGSPDARGTLTDWGGGQQVDYADSVLRHYGAIERSNSKENTMGLNIISGLISAGEGWLESGGNPLAAAAMGVAGAEAGGGATAGNLAGNVGNAAMGALDAQDEAFQVSMYAEQMHHDERMQVQSQAFNEMMDQKSEQMREVNTLRDVQMAQRKADNDIVKKFIQSITE